MMRGNRIAGLLDRLTLASTFTCIWFHFLIVTADASTSFDRISNPKVWDHIIFSQQWPETACMIRMESNQKCSIPVESVNRWTVHGVWAANGTHEGPAFCNNKWHFNSTELESLTPQLMKFWPNLFPDTPLFQLWNHEWKKHGTCVATLDMFNSQLKYFSLGIQLAEKFDLFVILAKYGILPTASKQFTVSDIQNAIQKEIGAYPTLSCDLEEKANTTYLREIRICLDKQVSPINCPNWNTTVMLESTLLKCPKDSMISYQPVKTATIRSLAQVYLGHTLQGAYSLVSSLMKLTL